MYRFVHRAGLCALLLAPAAGTAADSVPTPLLPAQFAWVGLPNNPAVKGAWVIGSERGTGVYLLRVQLANGGRIAPHTHPDERNSTVLSGTLYVGFGAVFDASKVVAVPAGAVYAAPANVAHYVWAKDGDVTYQEVGIGPTATTPFTR